MQHRHLHNKAVAQKGLILSHCRSGTILGINKQHGGNSNTEKMNSSTRWRYFSIKQDLFPLLSPPHVASVPKREIQCVTDLPTPTHSYCRRSQWPRILKHNSPEFWYMQYPSLGVHDNRGRPTQSNSWMGFGWPVMPYNLVMVTIVSAVVGGRLHPDDNGASRIGLVNSKWRTWCRPVGWTGESEIKALELK